MKEVVKKIFDEMLESYEDEEAAKAKFERTNDGFLNGKQQETRELIFKFRSKNLSKKLYIILQKNFMSLNQDVNYKFFEDYYLLGLHPERIAKKYKCPESKVIKCSEEVLKKLSVLIWGLDALSWS